MRGVSATAGTAARGGLGGTSQSLGQLTHSWRDARGMSRRALVWTAAIAAARSSGEMRVSPIQGRRTMATDTGACVKWASQ